MTRFLVSDENPTGYKLEEILLLVRADVLARLDRIALDERPEALLVFANNVQVLECLTKAIDLAKENTRVLDKAFGHRGLGGPPRIGAGSEGTLRA
jgi:hypothetical protein